MYSRARPGCSWDSLAIECEIWHLRGRPPYQILPTYPCARDERGSVFDLTSDESWLSDAQRPLLKAAREFRRELGTRSSVPAISIFGYGHKTITGLALRRDTGRRIFQIRDNHGTGRRRYDTGTQRRP